MEKIPLKVYGLSYSQKQSSVYALILGQVDGPIRIPVVIGPAEAQAIALWLESIKAPRPMTHDLFAGIANAFGIELRQVFIYKFQDGVFYCELTLSDGDREITMDARTSDAVAIALRTNSPIFTTREVLEETGFVLDEQGEAESSGSGHIEAPETQPSRTPSLENYSIEQLEKELAKAIDDEAYERAAQISEVLNRKKGGNPPQPQ